MFCSSCGLDIGDSRYCPRCGARSDYCRSGAAGSYASYVPMYNDRTVNKLAYFFMAFFLGTLGIHRFYAGRPVSGTVYLLLTLSSFVFLVPVFFVWLLSFIESIVALTRESDSNGNIHINDSRYFI